MSRIKCVHPVIPSPPPAPLEAMRWTQGFRQEVLDWTGGTFSSHNWEPAVNDGEPFDAIYLDDGDTFALDQRALLGDWILRSPFGNLWAVPHEKFIEIYTFE